ncbi:MAG TPA: hypothetical protein VGD96_15120 [Bradyrhizobium sp.]
MPARVSTVFGADSDSTVLVDTSEKAGPAAITVKVKLLIKVRRIIILSLSLS